jgi:hypothetical protein
MRLPLGSRIDGKVCKLKRCLYGLKQSPREWYSRLTNDLLPYGFALSAYDPCVLIHSSGNLFLAIYVDDISIFGPSDDLTENLITTLKTEFDVKDLGKIHWLLGIKIDLTDDGITLSQQTYIDKILERFSMQDCHSVSTPLDPDHNLRSGTSEQTDDIILYQQIIGSLMYTVTGTRPDLAYSVTHLLQFSSAPTSTHLQAAKRVLLFLKGTRDVKLTYKLGQPLVLEGFSDACYGNCLDTRRSFWGYLFQLGGATISWCSRRQRSVATSTAEAEYMAVSMTSKHHLWTLHLIKELLRNDDIPADIPAAIRSDNTAALDIAKNRHYHAVRELVESGQLTILHIDGKENLADICTKALPQATREHLCSRIFQIGGTRP